MSDGPAWKPKLCVLSLIDDQLECTSQLSCAALDKAAEDSGNSPALSRAHDALSHAASIFSKDIALA